MPGSSGLNPSVNGTGTKSDSVYVSLVVSATSTSAAPAVSSGCNNPEAAALSGAFDWDDTSFLGNGDDGSFGRTEYVHRKTRSTAAAAPAVAHSKVFRH